MLLARHCLLGAARLRKRNAPQVPVLLHVRLLQTRREHHCPRLRQHCAAAQRRSRRGCYIPRLARASVHDHSRQSATRALLCRRCPRLTSPAGGPMRLDRKPPSRGSWFHCGCATNSTHPQVLDSTARAASAGLCFTYCAELLCGWMAGRIFGASAAARALRGKRHCCGYILRR